MADPAEALGFGHDRLDEYARGAGRPPVGPRARQTIRVLTVVGAVLVGYLLVVGFRAGRTAAVAQSERHGELVELVRDQREHVMELSSTLEDLEEQVAATQERAATVVPALDEAMQRAQWDAGMVPMTGPGVVITFFDAPPDCVGARYLCEIQDYDLQLAANNLFVAGAEAVAAGEQRVVATTALRAAGTQITANYHILTPPFELRAIGDPDELAASVQSVGAALADAGTGLRMDVQRTDEVRVPGGSVPAIRIARPAGGATAGGDAS